MLSAFRSLQLHWGASAYPEHTALAGKTSMEKLGLGARPEERATVVLVEMGGRHLGGETDGTKAGTQKMYT